mmetsp:Transcript_3384/g.2937  ORF Transcript_3384/g.2937 Transcript_3384/m.2937 type:complete len:138 (+) Transcript_3384:1788-2201(+)
MTKVDVKKGSYGEYLFYRMQVLHDFNQDVYILFTRWGRIGEDGSYQNTPFSKKEDCIKEFKKVFHDKSHNDWDKKDSFEKKPHKYKLLDIENKKNVKDYIKPIDFKDPNLKPSELAVEIQGVFKAIANVDLYKKCMR